jgi:acyl-CoA thioester hydrolase
MSAGATVSETRLRVRYAETDQMGVVYYANYFVWMELGRVELCRSLGVRYRSMEEEDGVLLAVVEARCRYQNPARYDEEVIVRTRITESNARMITFGYEMLSAENGDSLATGETRHIFLSTEMKPIKLPEKYRPLFGIA